VASIKERADGKYRARYRDGAGKEHARHFERKVDAQRWLDEVTASMITGQYVDPRAGKVTLAPTSPTTRGARCGSPAGCGCPAGRRVGHVR
jgi:hypothetical protein